MAPTREAVVLVLGDVGRSPRMQYHALSLAQMSDVHVTLVGFAGERCCPPVETSSNITQLRLRPPEKKPVWLPFVLFGPFKVVLWIMQLLWALFWGVPRPTWVLVQNPPSIPTLLVAWIVCRLRGASLIVDWHNFGYTILGLKLGKHHPFVLLSRWYERLFGARADGHLCVTLAMKKWLLREWGINANVLYDRPPPFFRRTTDTEAHELFSRLRGALPKHQSRYAESRATAAARTATGQNQSDENGSVATDENQDTLFTTLGTAGPCLRLDRPALLVSSTSWTEDEDFGLLLRALVALDKVATDEPTAYPDFVVCVTGKGPLRSFYEAQFAELRLRRVHIRTLWLEADDYPRLLGAADAGICLHTSSSGLDLPMKVVDMFGAGLPALAVHYDCLGELVQDGTNGRIFRTATDLARELADLFRGFPGAPSAPALAKLSRGASLTVSSRWDDNWVSHAQPLFNPGLPLSQSSNAPVIASSTST